MRAWGWAASAAAGVLLATACSSSSSEFEPIIDPAEGAEPTTIDEATTTTLPPTFEIVEELADVDGLIATGGFDGLHILRPTGEVLFEFFDGRRARYPSWSRDGTKLVATLVGSNGDPSAVGVVDIPSLEMTTTPAERAYVFYSWSADSSSILGLGPSSTTNGFSAEMLDATGAQRFDSTIEASPLYIAWEPGGGDLVVHAGRAILLVEDPAEQGAITDLGPVGTAFQAPSWIPGTRDIVYVASADDGEGRVVRRSVDDDTAVDLGPARGTAAISVHPAGRRAAVAHSTADGSGRAPRVEIVDLATGVRSPVLDEFAVWLEWSPDGERLLIASERSNELFWSVWDGRSVTDLGAYEASRPYLANYLAFADAYVESPRLWSPDSTSFTFSEVADGVTVASVIRIDDGTRSQLRSAEVSFWSPRPPSDES